MSVSTYHNDVKKPRIRDVAALAGVAQSTVSVVLNNTAGARVKESTRQRVRAAAEQLGYTPNSVARSLRTQRSQTIALISDVIATTPYAGELIQGAQKAAWARGYLLLLVNTGGDEEVEDRAIAALQQQHVAGALYSTMFHREVAPPTSLAGSPVVFLDARPRGVAVPYVVPDEFGGAVAAIEDLVAHGHRRIAFLSDDHPGLAAGGRLAGYRAAMARHDLQVNEAWVIPEESTSRGGYRAMTQLLRLTDLPTAVFAFNDQMAAGVYRAAVEHGLRIPQDLSVIGFDNLILVAEELVPGLTTMALPHNEMGEVAATILIDMIESKDSVRSAAELTPPGILLQCPLIRRGSVALPQ